MSAYALNRITEAIIGMLEKGTVPWRQPWTELGPPQNLINNWLYKGINVFLLAAMGYALPYWLTLQQLQKLGGTLKCGEKPTEIACWQWWPRTLTKSDKDGKSKTQEKVLWEPRCWFHQVYNVEQCNGIERRVPKLKTHEFTPIRRCDQLINGMLTNVAVRHREPEAYYSPIFDFVNIPNRQLFHSDEEYYSTLFHELIHSTGHQSRLNRHKYLKTGFRPDLHEYTQEELVAEMGTAFLCAKAKISSRTLENSAAYIGHWLQILENDKRAVFHASAQAQKALEYIVNQNSIKSKNTG